MKFSLAFAAFCALTVQQVAAHGAIIAYEGVSGTKGRALGIDVNTPRDGRGRNPFQQDTAIIRDRDIASGRAGACGRTLGGGNIDIPAGIAGLTQELGTLPEVAAGQPMTITVHQINGDGAGPYTCEVDQTGTGENFQEATVTTNLPGRRGNNRATSLTDQPLVVNMPANLACTGGAAKNVCLVRCRNPARAGPFGGCMPVQQAGAVAAQPAAAPAPAAGVEVAAAGADAAGVEVAAAGADAAGVEVAGAGVPGAGVEVAGAGIPAGVEVAGAGFPAGTIDIPASELPAALASREVEEEEEDDHEVFAREAEEEDEEEDDHDLSARAREAEDDHEEEAEDADDDNSHPIRSKDLHLGDSFRATSIKSLL
ncbi:uncharacterized protein EV422DRAFT_518960 [Fimicolochytrium jonesii]|uniref:uncharacterized protein n=1 Tax=Fimicolochytrium jonesii TaxID=1396493 RepID=UPI0022FEF69E|nr:uncharacterized protein EV422DRAFT_518960 [Fimicolochytrium jonesii]KAI8824122.1 hypothetical protein EV422DRAFT_518960 [Fimicolochytrium jonesii]